MRGLLLFITLIVSIVSLSNQSEDFPFGDGSYPKDQIVKQDEQREVSIGGKITLVNPPPLLLTAQSCVGIKLEDVSLQDVGSHVLARKYFTVTNNMELADDSIPYLIRAKKPLASELWRDFIISVVVNMGWCGEKVNG